MLATRPRRIQRGIKRILDPVLASLLLLALSPLFLVISLWIVLESGRPVFFNHPRAGKHGRPFTMFKFRTMVQNAIELGRKLHLSDDPFGVLPEDPRITRSGRFLRRTGLDELPQLGNVVLGQMSLVGPRPDLVEQAANYTDSDARRLAVLPGITGWSQVNGREEIPWPERFEQDAWYVDNWSLWLDAKILLKTVAQPFRGQPTPVEDTMNIERAKAREAKPAG